MSRDEKNTSPYSSTKKYEPLNYDDINDDSLYLNKEQEIKKKTIIWKFKLIVYTMKTT